MKLLKFAFLLSFLSIFFSCSNDDSRDDQDNEGKITYNYLPATKAEILKLNPEGETSVINVSYLLANACQSFEEFKILKQTKTGRGHTIDVRVLGSAKSEGLCIAQQQEKEEEFEFKPESAGKYTIRFWNGNEGEGAKSIDVEMAIPSKEELK